MRCPECGGHYRQRRGQLRIPDLTVGEIVVANVNYSLCQHCQDILLPLKTVAAIDRQRQELITEYLQSRCHPNEFVSAAQAAQMLGITRQALNKHPRIKRGFIYQTISAGRRVYLTESVQQFMAKGDGRFPLNLYQCPENAYYQDAGPTAALFDPHVYPSWTAQDHSLTASIQYRQAVKNKTQVRYAS